MFRQIMQIKFVLNGREYIFSCENDSPTMDVKEIACQLIKSMVQIEDNAKAQAEAQAIAEEELKSKIEPIPEENQA